MFLLARVSSFDAATMATPLKKPRAIEPIFIVGLGTLLFCFLAQVTPAQEAIRVETNQVLVPVRVIDAERNRSLYANPAKLDQALAVGDTRLAEHILEETVFQGLTAVGFEIFEDGKRQEIQSVGYRHSLYWDLRDNQGHHTEFAGPGGGKWSTAEWPVRWKGDLQEPYYLLAYSPPESQEGTVIASK
jgi:hypothetical protein